MTLKRAVPFYVLLVLAVVCLCIGEMGLGGKSKLIEYVASYSAPQPDEVEEDEVPLLISLANVRDQLPGYSFSAFTLKRNVYVQSDCNRSASGSVYSIAEGWFDLYHRTLVAGRLPGEGELQTGAAVAVINAEMACLLWGERQTVGRTFWLDQMQLTVIGIVDHGQEAGQTDAGEIYIPLRAALQMGLDADVQVLAGDGDQQGRFERIAGNAMSDGTLYRLQQERVRAGMPLRCLCVGLLIWLLCRTWPWIGACRCRAVQQWRARWMHVYAAQMIFPTLKLLLLCLGIYGGWIGMTYTALNIAIVPVYVFKAWVPEDPFQLGSYGKVMRKIMEQWSPLQITMTESVLSIRYYGRLIGLGVILLLVAGMIRPRLAQMSPRR